MTNCYRHPVSGTHIAKCLAISAMLFVSACDSSLVREARQAEDDGGTISNEMMTAMYPESFRAGDPAYLERDFEAGADFICDQLEIEHSRDLCAEMETRWR